MSGSLMSGRRRNLGLLPTLQDGYTTKPTAPRTGFPHERSNKVGASVARCPRTPPDAAKTPGLQIGFSDRLRGQSNRSIVVVCNYCCGPITAEPYRAKERPFLTP